MQNLGTWFSGGIDSVRLVAGLNDLEGLLQPKRSCDSMILSILPLLLFLPIYSML